MAKGLVLVIVAALAISLSGCGTVGMATSGIAGPVPMYFGVQEDVKEGIWLDVPFSAAADTALLPFTTVIYGINVCYWWTLDEKQKEEFADYCPFPSERTKRMEGKKIEPNNGN